MSEDSNTDKGKQKANDIGPQGNVADNFDPMDVDDVAGGNHQHLQDGSTDMEIPNDFTLMEELWATPGDVPDHDALLSAGPIFPPLG